MPYRFVLDEQLRRFPWYAICRHNQIGSLPLDVVRVGDLPDLPLGTDDADLLTWAEANDRIIVSRDYRTMTSHFLRHLQSGRHSPGVLLLRPNVSQPMVVDTLVDIAYASLADEWHDRIEFIP